MIRISLEARMDSVINVYCDESCHLEHDSSPAMVLGATWCPSADYYEISKNLRSIKMSHGLSRDFEIKWTKVSPAKLQFYIDLVDYFFDDPRLHFRAVVIPDKSILNHESFKQNHDTWYYKMWFVLLKQILDPKSFYKIYLDIKDTRSQRKIKYLHEVLCNDKYDFDKKIIRLVQQVRSHEVEIMQITDLFIGAIGYVHRRLSGSDAKLALIKRIGERADLNLSRTTLPREDKVNLLIWHPREW
ncbi:MAG TPA: DUF3800 domain-containing protein [Candidatus Deferrimicrobium sp.]